MTSTNTITARVTHWYLIPTRQTMILDHVWHPDTGCDSSLFPPPPDNMPTTMTFHTGSDIMTQPWQSMTVQDVCVRRSEGWPWEQDSRRCWTVWAATRTRSLARLPRLKQTTPIERPLHTLRKYEPYPNQNKNTGECLSVLWIQLHSIWNRIQG